MVGRTIVGRFEGFLVGEAVVGSCSYSTTGDEVVGLCVPILLVGESV